VRPIDIELWINRVAERVARGSPLEDSRVELKRDWPQDHNKAARQIAGLCNAMAGDDVLWIVGIDEKVGVVGAQHSDLATWWPTVASEFDGTYPRPQDLIVNLRTADVIALVFETDRAPYVVRNAMHGKPNGGPVAWEVPWREGASTRTARRADLLRILIPTQSLPTVEVVRASADLRMRTGGRPTVTITVVFYTFLPVGESVVLPDRQASGWCQLGDHGERVELEVTLAAQQATHWRTSPVRSTWGSQEEVVHTVLQGDAQVILSGPGFFRAIGRGGLDVEPEATELPPIVVGGQLRPAGGDLAIPFELSIPFQSLRPDPPGGHAGRWQLSDQ